MKTLSLIIVGLILAGCVTVNPVVHVRRATETEKGSRADR